MLYELTEELLDVFLAFIGFNETCAPDRSFLTPLLKPSRGMIEQIYCISIIVWMRETIWTIGATNLKLNMTHISNASQFNAVPRLGSNSKRNDHMLTSIAHLTIQFSRSRRVPISLLQPLWRRSIQFLGLLIRSERERRGKRLPYGSHRSESDYILKVNIVSLLHSFIASPEKKNKN